MGDSDNRLRPKAKGSRAPSRLFFPRNLLPGSRISLTRSAVLVPRLLARNCSPSSNGGYIMSRVGFLGSFLTSAALFAFALAPTSAFAQHGGGGGGGSHGGGGGSSHGGGGGVSGGASHGGGFGGGSHAGGYAGRRHSGSEGRGYEGGRSGGGYSRGGEQGAYGRGGNGASRGMEAGRNSASESHPN